MAVIADFPAYPQWASGVKMAEIVQTDSDGRPVQVRFSLDAGGIIKDKYVLGYTWSGDDEVRWTLVERGSMVSDMTGAYLLEPDRQAAPASPTSWRSGSLGQCRALSRSGRRKRSLTRR